MCCCSLLILLPEFWHIQTKAQVTSKTENMLNCSALHKKIDFDLGKESRTPVSQKGISIKKKSILPFWWSCSTGSSKLLSTVSKIEIYHPKDNDKINSIFWKSQKYSSRYHFPSWLETLIMNSFLIPIMNSCSPISCTHLLVLSLWLPLMLCTCLFRRKKTKPSKKIPKASI